MTGNTRCAVDGGCRKDLPPFIKDTIIRVCAPGHLASLVASREDDAKDEPAMKTCPIISMAALFSNRSEQHGVMQLHRPSWER